MLKRLTEQIVPFAGAGRPSPAGSADTVDLQRHCRVWSALGYGVGAMQGWLTGCATVRGPRRLNEHPGTAGDGPP